MTRRPAGVRLEPLPEGVGPALGPFARALRTGTGAALAFLPGVPADETGWTPWLAQAAASGPVPEALARRLAERQEALGAGPRAAAAARALAAPGTVAVVTGQQPGLFGGPLLTAHKAAGAITLARRLDGLGGHRVVPVFWSASEDHDLDEANRATVIGREGELVTVRADLEADGRSIADVDAARDAGDALGAAWRALAAALPDTPRAREALDRLAPAPEDGFAAAAARALLALFGDSGLVLLEPEQLRPASGATLAWLVEQAAPIGEAVRRTGVRLAEAGLPAPLDPAPGTAPVFYRREPGGRRLRVHLEADGGVRLRGAPADLDARALAAALRARPELGSGDVVGRVFVQNEHLPVLAYVAGPTEIAYQAQVRAAAEALGRPFPLCLPRPEATWVPAKAARIAADLDLAVPDVLLGAAPDLDPDAAVEAGLEAARRHLEAWPAAFEALRARGGDTGPAAARAAARATQAFAKAAADVQKAAQDDAGVGRGRFERLQALLRPFERPQERALSPWSLVARHGLAPVRAGLLSLDPLVPAHTLVHLGGQNHGS